MSAPEPLSYSHRPRPMGGEVLFRLDPGHLFVDSGRKQERIPFVQIASVRLSYQPSNASMSAFRTLLRLKDGRSVKIGNLSWRGYFEAERQDDAYRAFVRALLARIAQASPGVKGLAGQPALLWALASLAGIAMIAGLIAVAFAASRTSWTALALAALFLLPLGWQVWAIASRNRPRLFALPDAPAEVLP